MIRILFDISRNLNYHANITSTHIRALYVESKWCCKKYGFIQKGIAALWWDWVDADRARYAELSSLFRWGFGAIMEDSSMQENGIEAKWNQNTSQGGGYDEE